MKMLFGNNDFTDLEQRAHVDLAARARGGTVIYLLVWLISAIWVGMFQSAPLFFAVNSAFFLATALMRVMHHRLLSRCSAANTKKMYYWLVAILLLSAMHWGVLAAWVIFSGDYPLLYYPYILTLAAFGTGGAAVFSISRVVSIAYPLLIFTPTLLLLFIAGGEENMMMLIFAIFTLVYVLNLSNLSRNDYWTAVVSQKVAEDQARVMEKLSVTDQLTRLNNRLYFENRFIEEWERCGRLNVPVAIFMIDLDHFKLINDTHGHAAGDACLARVASVLRAEMKRTIDTVARYGGEEFVVLISVTDIKALPILADKLVRAIANIDMRWNEERIALSCSVGLASTVPSRNMNKEKLLIAADKALYQAKRTGRNRFCIYDEPSRVSNIRESTSRKAEDAPDMFKNITFA